MNINRDQFDSDEEYHNFLNKLRELKEPTLTNKIHDQFNTFKEDHIDNREPLDIPTEYVGIAAFATALVAVFTWPILLIGMIAGAFGVYKMGCPSSDNGNRSSNNGNRSSNNRNRSSNNGNRSKKD